MFFRDYYFSSGNSRVNRLIALFRCIVGLMKQIYLLHWNMDLKTEMRSYIKCRIRLNIDLK